VVQLLIERGARVRLLVRDEEKARTLFGDGVEIVTGDVRRPETLAPAMEGAGAVICATGARAPIGGNAPQKVDYEGVANLASAAKANGVDRFVLVSSIGATNPNHPLNAFGKVLTWKKRGEDALRSSGLTYTVIRPGGLQDAPGEGRGLKFDQGDRISGMVSRDDVAAACIEALDQPTSHGATFEMIATDGPRATWDALFATLAPDSDRA
jgi:uncharacterized protein YbjT (DUF2867 family)